ncbi:uncharacterized protein HD556DRAFT_1534549 [Suillus plorans]|uniref:DUF6533 domain-containing protein n=1 Tax=Suillus plorans TaxID=116603 RepID=A0A9P7DNX2_9AGAM|nr:uncharacterized protein HD556DRAFT_1534549 [Suillus plorans]KAG1799359.1 hypothetical protein HD556DRAFT_1534549 [Suillus plorans]
MLRVLLQSSSSLNNMRCMIPLFVDSEVNILWGTKWTASRILFFINRYFGLAVIIASTFFDVHTNPVNAIHQSYSQLLDVDVSLLAYLFTSHAFTNFDIIGLFLVLNIEIILLRRLFALYDYTNEFVLFGVCEETIPSWFIPFWTPIMAFDFVIMVLAGFKSMQHYIHVPNKNWSGARLMKTLARDSFVYFACNFLNYLAITFVFHLAPPEFFQLGASWTIVIPPIAANHLLINMEQSRFRDTNSTTDSRTNVESESSKDIELTQRHVQNTALLAVV